MKRIKGMFFGEVKMVRRGTSEELKLIVREIANRFVQFGRLCETLSLNIVHGSGGLKKIMVCTQSRAQRRELVKRSSWVAKHPLESVINSKCTLMADYQGFKRLCLAFEETGVGVILLKFGIIDKGDKWIWYVGHGYFIDMEALPDPSRVYVLSIKDVFKNMLKALILAMEDVRTPPKRAKPLSSGIPLDGFYVFIYELYDDQRELLTNKVLPFLASLTKSRLRWLSYV